MIPDFLVLVTDLEKRRDDTPVYGGWPPFVKGKIHLIHLHGVIGPIVLVGRLFIKMMFDPPDYPYKELSETFDDLLLSKNSCSDVPDAAHETIINNISNPLSFHSNNSGRYFSTDSTFMQENSSNLAPNTSFYSVQSEYLLNYEPTLLDENTVNQFLIPLQDSAINNKEIDNSGPDLLALHSCVICHDIFTTEADLLDHTIAFHASANITEADLAYSGTLPEQEPETLQPVTSETSEANNNNADTESDWLCCRVCQRVLSTALEVEPAEQLCCIDINGKGSVTSRRLHTMFVCDICSGLFADGESLDQHRITCYGEDGIYETANTLNSEVSLCVSRCPDVCFTCVTCGKQFMSAEDMKTHLLGCQRPRNVRRSRTYAAASSTKMWNCGSCNQLFATARELYRHKRGEDRPEGAPLTAYVCEDCDKVLGSMCALHTHKKMHKVSKPGYPCRICGRRFNQSGHLAIHMRMHTGERPYPCDLCPKAFKVKVERDDHRRTHTGERPFACAACPKTFTAAARLREHARIHTDQRPYICDICGAAFRRPYARTVHTLIHTGEKPHECDVCGTAFRRSGDMWKHKRTLHGA